ncbi:hypothetical protein GCM10009117_16060 [Gangjinia marincola]|uniref:Tetratricopeptide repeat protein n=1 Tax=Gangjinia marincola TaxID=578463 RepID=A0ABP3XVQ5_9FLAO
MASAYKSLGDTPKAIEYYQKAIGMDDNLVISKTDLGKLYSATGKLKKADSLFTHLSQAYPDNPNFQFQLGVVRQKQNDTTAITQFERAIALDSSHQKALYQAAKAHLILRNYYRVKIFCETGFKTYPNNPELINMMAQMYFIKGFHLEAIEWFEKLLALGKSDKFIHEKLALCYKDEHEPEKASIQFKKALQYDNQDENLYYELRVAQTQLEQYVEAQNSFEKAIFFKEVTLAPEYLALAGLFQRQEKYKEAIEHYKLAISESPRNAFAHYRLAIAADNYYADKKLVLSYYENFRNEFEDSKRNGYIIQLANRRIKMLKEEIFLSEGAKN